MRRKKKGTTDIRTALQTLLAAEHVTPEGDTQTGAEVIACILYQQATDPLSPHYAKAVDTIMKITNEHTQLENDVMRCKLIKQTEPPDPFYDIKGSDPDTLKVCGHIRKSITDGMR